MASLGLTFRSDLAALLFCAVAIPNIADNAASSPITNIEVSLHTASPLSGNQTTSESGYTSYARVSVARTTGGYTDTDGVTNNDSAITFPTSTGGSSTITDVGLGTAHTGSGKIMLAGALNASATITSGQTPSFAIGSLTITLS